jgi:hypothetical protein
MYLFLLCAIAIFAIRFLLSPQVYTGFNRMWWLARFHAQHVLYFCVFDKSLWHYCVATSYDAPDSAQYLFNRFLFNPNRGDMCGNYFDYLFSVAVLTSTARPSALSFFLSSTVRS